MNLMGNSYICIAWKQEKTFKNQEKMKRRKFIEKTLVTGTVIGLAATSTNKLLASPANEQNQKGTIIHSVYFWLKPNLTEQEEKQFLTFFDLLKKIPGVSSLVYGKPAPTTKREVTDNTFSYNLIITFKNMEDINNYETHPEHVKAASEYAKFWDRVQVRDCIVD
ncbi:Stress responsive A/B Barrel Domain [Porphyromonadaceae bacterium KH3CP3RA]|nr:Stress responsive A/B Barrel Domain [Porphyromonadaceae bacterium KH3CP3RA]